MVAGDMRDTCKYNEMSTIQMTPNVGLIDNALLERTMAGYGKYEVE